MIANRPDWTLSRQRQWGVPMPFFVHKETGALHPRTLELLEQVAQGRRAGRHRGVAEASPPSRCSATTRSTTRRSSDTLDVWFDSGQHAPDGAGRTGRAQDAARARMRSETGFPADLYLEGSDQHRGWFHSSLLVSCMLNGVPPYKALLTHGFAVDGEGKKMSKSKGNVVAPQKVSDTLGAEILRLWVGATDYSGELSISDEILKRVVESYRRHSQHAALPAREHRRLRSGARMRCRSASSSRSTATRSRRRARSPMRSMADYARYEFHLVVQRLQTYCSEDLGGFYLDVLKDRLYTTARDSRARRSAQTALALIRDALLKLLAPILSFTAEEAWRILHPDDATIFVHTWPDMVRRGARGGRR